MDKIAINLGPINITWYALCIFTGFILASIIISKESKRQKISDTYVTDMIFWCLIFGIIGARIYFVLFNLDYYMLSPLEMIKVWNGGLAIHGGIILGLITLIVCCKKHNINALKMTDIVVPGLILAQAIGRWGNFFNQEAHGTIVSKTFLENLHLPNFIINGMNINGSYYHPTFLYESILSLLGFIILMILRRNKKIKVGNLTSFYLIWYGLVRFFIEGIRTDSLMLGRIRIAQLVSLLMVFIGIIMLIITSIKCDKYNKENVKNAK